MDLQIFALLTQDGITNGAVYALLALALVLVFAVTRVIWIPSGEFVAYGTLTLAGLAGSASRPAPSDCWSAWRWSPAPSRSTPACAAARRAGFRGSSLLWTGIPLAIAGIAWWLAHARAAVLGADPGDAGAGHAARSAALPDRLPAARRGERAGAADRLGRRALRADRARPVVLRRRRARARRRSRRSRSSSAASTSASRACSSCSTSVALIAALYLFFGRTLVRQGAARDRAQPRRRAAGRHLAQSRGLADVRAGGAAVRVLRRADRAVHDRLLRFRASS